MDKSNLQKSDVVEIRKLTIRYGCNLPILNNFDMSVKHGDIYSLIGPSGCGKTTVISCIVGILDWEAGNVLMFGKDSRATNRENIQNVGYMPQELALYDRLTIRETVQLYGRLKNMKDAEISERFIFMQALLDLPDTKKLINKLSDGQKRHVSLALALVHSPKLLVLDEPTVGLDPLLRERIWQYLHNITNSYGSTIIITTHYMEEARHSNTVGVMRNGHLIAQQSPTKLLNDFGSDLLEDVVLQLFKKLDASTYTSTTKTVSMERVYSISHAPNIQDNTTECTSSPYDIDSSKEFETGQPICLGSQFWKSVRRIYALCIALMLSIVRLPTFLGFMLFMPTIQVVLTTLALGSNMQDMHFGIVNHELTTGQHSCNLIATNTNIFCNNMTFSCLYTSKLAGNNTLLLDYYEDEKTALNEVQKGNSWGYVVFPQNYTKHMLNYGFEKRFSLNDTLEGIQIRAHLDYSQQIASTLLIRHLFRSYKKFVYQLSQNCNQEGIGVSRSPLHFRPPVYGSYDGDSKPFVLPGIVNFTLVSMVFVLTALLFIYDRKRGTLQRARIAGLSSTEVIASHLITQGIFVVPQVVILSATLFLGFSTIINISLPLYLAFCILIGIYAATLGILAGIVATNELQVLVIGMVVAPVCLFFGDAIFSAQYMSTFWQYFGYLTPTKLPTQGLRSAMIRGLNWNHRLVIPGLLALIGKFFIVFICNIYALKKFQL